MRNTHILSLCLISAAAGAVAASIWWNTPSLAPAVHAQEPPRAQAGDPSGFPAPRLPATNRPGDANRTPLALGPAPTLEGAEELTPEERVNVAVYEGCNRSVVNIKTEASGTNMFLLDVVQEGTGSGSVLDQQGHILTNYHVVEGAKEIQVTLYDSKDYPARVVAKDASTDVAILKIDAPPDSLFPVHFGDSTRLKVGQRIYALGNPFGLERTLTTGVVSSLDRTLPSRSNRTIKSVIQVDAAINPGNSGGPLLDTHGRLIGMTTAIASRTGQNTGVGFAIPSSVIARVVPELIATGHVTRPDTGIAKVYETDKGLLIAAVQPGGPADQAGLRGFKITKTRKQQGFFTYDVQSIDRSAADIITAVNGKPTLTADDFLSVVDSFHPGDDVDITIIRDGHETQIRVHLAAGDS
ncbi:MAG TPA: trypsin-like peptidase domain-containing protein [Pirellulales bacterium]|nr:trypsin-like peptidase domain-containing protein [Pirellulales bacterium]